MSEQYFTRPNVQPVITNIGTTPEQRQMSTSEFKAKFDEMPEAIQQYIKETLLTELDAFKQEFMTHQADYATHEHDGNDTPYIKWTNVSDKPGLPRRIESREIPAGATHNFGSLDNASVHLVAASRYTTGSVLWVVLPGTKSVFKIHGDGQQGVASFDGSNFTYKAHAGGGEFVRIIRL